MAASLKSYEKKYKALEDIVKQLDDGDMTISELLSQYKKGLTLVKECLKCLTLLKMKYNKLSKKSASANKEILCSKII